MTFFIPLGQGLPQEHIKIRQVKINISTIWHLSAYAALPTPPSEKAIIPMPKSGNYEPQFGCEHDLDHFRSLRLHHMSTRERTIHVGRPITSSSYSIKSKINAFRLL